MQARSNDASAREETLTDADDLIEDSGNQLAEAERAERAKHANIDFALRKLQREVDFFDLAALTECVDQRLLDLTCPRFEGSIFGVPTSCDAGQCRCSAEGPTIEHECSVDRNEHKHEQTCSSQGQVLNTHR